MSIKIYLADLVYDTIKTNFVVPLNIGYVAAYAKDRFRDDIDITLFKYPKELEKEIKSNPPDVLGLSNYSWNDRLDKLFLKMAKEVNPDMVTVMGGPNASVSSDDMRHFLEDRPELDYYVLYEGEKPFSNIIEFLLNSKGKFERTRIEGTAVIGKDGYSFNPLEFKDQNKELLIPSPYLSGLLDKFIADPDMMPLLETNRGCPYGCVYCEWGAAALSKVKDRMADQVYEEINYISEKSAGQKIWIICDANFGIKERDLDFAKYIRKIKSQYGSPAEVVVWHSKNTTQRNIDIVETLGEGATGCVAIQSSDEEVLRLSGRGAIKFDRLKKFIKYYKDRNLPVSTDILVGLPGESADSHLKTLCDAFDLGFTKIEIYNIRMLDGTSYATKESRQKYEVKVKYRPVFGAYGIYNGKKVFEVEESVRSTKDMTEEELNGFKILHWLIYLAWNSGIFRNQLKLSQKHGLNPAMVLHSLSKTDHPVLRPFFDQFLKESMDEWFETAEDMHRYYQEDDNFNRMLKDFAKLNFYYIAKAFHDSRILNALKAELEGIIKSELVHIEKNKLDELFKALGILGQQLICSDPFQSEMSFEFDVSGEVAAVIFEKPVLINKQKVSMRISRTHRSVELCKNFFHDKQKVSLNDWLRFLENRGLTTLTNHIEVAEPELEKTQTHELVSN